MITENQNLQKLEQLKQEEFDMGGEENMILEDIAKKVTQDHWLWTRWPFNPALLSVGVQ